jgi:hypothetical protein
MSDWHLYADFKNGANIGGGIQYVWMFGQSGVSVLMPGVHKLYES